METQHVNLIRDQVAVTPELINTQNIFLISWTPNLLTCVKKEKKETCHKVEYYNFLFNFH